jgi:hypothetical protein
MIRPLYSFEAIQAGPHLLVDACVPFSVGVKIFALISAAAGEDQASVATKRPPTVPMRKPGFGISEMAAPEKQARSAPTAAKRRPRN